MSVVDLDRSSESAEVQSVIPPLTLYFDSSTSMTAKSMSDSLGLGHSSWAAPSSRSPPELWKPPLPMTPSPVALQPSPPSASAVDGGSVSRTVVSTANSFVSSLMIFEQGPAVSATGLPPPSQPVTPVEQASPASPALTRYPARPTRSLLA